MPEVSRMGEVRRRSSGGTGTASVEPEDNQGIDLSKVEIPEVEVDMYNNLQRKEGEKEKVEFADILIGQICFPVFFLPFY